MVTAHEQPDWSTDLTDSVWFHIGNYLSINDINRLSRTCVHLHTLFTSNDFWSYLIRVKFGTTVWRRFVKNSSILSNEISELASSTDAMTCRSKLIYSQLNKRQCISFADFSKVSFDNNRNYTTFTDSSSLNGEVLYVHDSIEFCYSLHIETTFKNILPGRYDVICRMKLDLPYMLGDTEFVAIAEQTNPSEIAFTRWTQDDFLSMYRCFNYDLSKANLWFYQRIGIVEIQGNERCNIYVSISNQDPTHAKHGLYLDYVELKLRLD
ncbi:unnamed protein product [Rotaria magnacalcarata]|uniref:F-box domain-containing protein n=1 Tax=Rotaria magnacalcarata TaxID=392030 RepID=A0A816VJU0_9BILA|nr:unnamed protein product [Rotaria magnacalcarata]CAF2124639.1 unnamed protein product [Rotaria magnacalcarata]CAF3986543.1 unnamed protein product [Rotaria magnacalcarata]CAF4111670.1 unnamed protein product [Rotaria magnacalcarata]